MVEPSAVQSAAAIIEAANYNWLWWVVAAIVVLLYILCKYPRFIWNGGLRDQGLVRNRPVHPCRG
jgi:hypothetical protein